MRKQVDFYFSDANLRRDSFLRGKMKDGGGFVELALLLQFNRLRALKCTQVDHLVQAIQKSDLLVLSDDMLRVRRDFDKAPQEEVDPLLRIVYLEGLPLHCGIDDLTVFCSQHGRVRFIELPRRRETREPMGFCFVEYATEAEAQAAVKGLDRQWNEAWPTRHDGKALRAMPKQQWLQYKKEHQARQRPGRTGDSAASTAAVTASTAAETTGSGSAQPTDAGPEASSQPVAAPQGEAPRGEAPRGEAPRGEAPQGEAPAEGGASSAPRVPRGCLMRVSGFSQPQTRLSIRQFAEHAVSVLYCDFEPGYSAAHLRLRSPADCDLLLEDLRLTGRLLGWLRPEVATLSAEQEEQYWREANAKRVPRETLAVDAKHRPKRVSASRHLKGMLSNPQGVVDGGPTKTTTVHRWPSRGARAVGSAPLVADASPEPAASGDPDGGAGGSAPSVVGLSLKRRQASSFVDTVGGNARFAQGGFGRPPRLRRRLGAIALARKASAAAGATSPRRRPPRPPPRPKPPRVAGAPAGKMLKRAVSDSGALPGPPAKSHRQAAGSMQMLLPPPSPMPRGAQAKKGPKKAAGMTATKMAKRSPDVSKTLLAPPSPFLANPVGAKARVMPAKQSEAVGPEAGAAAPAAGIATAPAASAASAGAGGGPPATEAAGTEPESPMESMLEAVGDILDLADDF